MKWVPFRILLTVLGVVLLVFLNIDGIPGFLLTTLGLFLIIIGVTFRGIVQLISNIL